MKNRIYDCGFLAACFPMLTFACISDIEDWFTWNSVILGLAGGRKGNRGKWRPLLPRDEVIPLGILN